MSRRDRQRRRKHRSGGSSRVAFLTLGVLAACGAIGGLAVAGWGVRIMGSAPPVDTIKPVEQVSASVGHAPRGQRLGFITAADTLRTPIPRDAIPTNVRNATVAIEDRRFYSHKGVDVEGVFRAAVKNISSHRTVEGGSTLTMQLIKNLYDPGKQRTFTRKVREAKLAQELENEHPGIEGKRWILDRYLNSVPYGTIGGRAGGGRHGAARPDFAQPARRATVLRQAGQPPADVGARAARRPAAGAVALQPLPRRAARAVAPQRGP